MASNNENSKFRFHVGDALWKNIFRKQSSQTETTITILRRIPLFKEMRKSELLEFEKIIHRRRYKPDETIFWEGEPGVGMYIVQEGRVAIFKNVSEQNREQLAKLRSGEFFGELALLDESPRSATAVALKETKILGLFRPDLLELIKRHPRLGNRFLFHLAELIGERLKHTNEELQSLWNKVNESKVLN